MASASDFLENEIIDTLIRGDTPYVALYTVAPTDAGGGTEVTGGSYARQAVTLSAAVGGNTSNANVLTFTAMPSCTVVAWAIHNHVSAGDMKVHDTCTAKTYTAGENATIAGGELDITVT